MKYREDLAQKLSLLENELHVWSISLIQPEKILQKLAGLLDENERTKANKFKFEIDRQNYIVAHGAMRQILAKYLECKPENIIFNFNDYGKPFLPENKYQIEFNLSHSKSRALVAVAKNKRVGIDIEYIRSEIVESNIAGQFFSARENEALQSLDANQQQKAFFDCWTRKESFIKAIGKGLSFPLKSFDVSLKPADPARLLYINDSRIEAARWQMVELIINENYSATAVIESTVTNLKISNWKDFTRH